MNTGLGQTGDTCWFNSSLNIFLTSDNGLKILWKKLTKVYAGLGTKQKAYFDSNIKAPCPYGKPNKTPPIYFWKFLNQYICAVGGPGSLIPKSGLNAYLTKNIKWKNPGLRESKGTTGGWPHVELPTILNRLGFKKGSDYIIRNIQQYQYSFNTEWTNPILLLHGEKRGQTYYGMTIRDLVLVKGKYDLTGAIIYVRPTDESSLNPHVWACSVRNGKGYITDSNFPMSPKLCTWWDKESLLRYFGTVERNYRPNVARIMVFDVLLYTRRDYTNAIAPYCLMPAGGYRPLTNANKATLNEVTMNYGPNAGSYFMNTSEARQRVAPRIAAEVKRQYAARPLLSAAALQNIVNKAGSFNHAMRLVNRKVRYENFRVNKGGPNFRNFRKKLAAKFPTPISNNIFKFLWRNSNSNSQFEKRLRNYAEKTGLTVNENQLKGILGTRAKTRAGVKRKLNAETERMYLVNSKAWYNSNGTNVTNRIKTNNWTRTNNNNKSQLVRSYANGTSVKTYKRKLG